MLWRVGFEQSGTISDLALAFEDAEDDGLAVGAATAPALDPTRPEEAFVDLDDPEQGALDLAGKQDTFPQGAVEPVHGVAVQAAQGRRLKGRQVGGEVANDIADLGLGNPRTPCVFVFHCHASLYATYRDTQLGMTHKFF